MLCYRSGTESLAEWVYRINLLEAPIAYKTNTNSTTGDETITVLAPYTLTAADFLSP